MQVTINCGAPKDLKELFRFEIDFLEFYITSDVVYIIANKKESYVHKEFPVISRHNFSGEQSLRIERKDFLSLALEGELKISIIGNEATLQFSNDKTSFKTTRRHQKSDISSILQKMDILGKNSSFSRHNFSSLKRIMPLLSGFTAIVNVMDNMVVASDGNLELYCRVEAPNMSCMTSTLNFLLQKTESHFLYQNYIIGYGEGVIVLLRQTIPSIESSFDYIDRMKTSHKIKLDVSNVSLLSKRIRGNSIIDLDINKEEAFIDSGKVTLSTEFKVISINTGTEQTGEADTRDPLASLSLDSGGPISLKDTGAVPLLKVPSKFFSTYMSYQDKTNLTIFIKRNFILIRPARGIFFVLGRARSV